MRLFLLLALIATTSAGFAQSLQASVVGSAGDMFLNNTGSLTWTIGEAITETHSKSERFLTQGFHQPTVIKVTGLWEDDTHEPILVYPNPFLNKITVERAYGVFVAALLDLQGRAILSTTLNFSEQSSQVLEISSLPQAMYILKLWDVQTMVTYHIKLQKL